MQLLHISVPRERSQWRGLGDVVEEGADCLACSSGSFLRKLRNEWLPLGWIIIKPCCGVVWKKTIRNSETLNDPAACLCLVSSVSTLPLHVMKSRLWSLCGPVRLFWYMITNWIANPGHSDVLHIWTIHNRVDKLLFIYSNTTYTYREREFTFLSVLGKQLKYIANLLAPISFVSRPDQIL